MKPLKKYTRVFKASLLFKIVLILFFLLALKPILYACSWYPEPEEYRFVLFNPSLSNQKLQPFFFTSHFLYDYENLENRYISTNQNLQEWIEYTGYQGDKKAIDHVLNYVSPEGFAEWIEKKEKHSLSANPFIQFLEKNKKQEIIDYLRFAKKCEIVNTEYKADPWADKYEEKNELGVREDLKKEGGVFYQSSKDNFIKFRIGFQLVRLARYANDVTKTKIYYEQYIKPFQSESIIYYWATWHYAEMTADVPYRNYLYSIVFEKAHDKKVRAFNLFDSEEAESALSFAENDHEKANILVLKTLNYVGRALPDIKRIFALDPQNEGLGTLLIREINKLEDWLLTERYTEFELTVMIERNGAGYDDFSKIRAKNRQKDLTYVKELLNFVENAPKDKVDNPSLWHLMSAYLAFMDSQFEKASQYLNEAQKAKGLNDRIEAQIHLVRIMSELHPENTNKQHDDFLLSEIQWLEQNQQKVYSFRKTFSKLMMVLTNRYKEAGNMVRATLFHGKINDYVRFEGVGSPKDKYEYNRETGEGFSFNFYSSYLFFLDEQASIKDIEAVLTFLDRKDKTPLENYFSKELNKDRIQDLLGIKYLRENNLSKAREAFKLVSNDFWLSKNESYRNNLNANPFYTNFYQEHTQSLADTVRFTKYTLVDSLIKVLQKAENVKEPNRAKWYFLAANCYLNMTFFGNSWIMTRYWWSNSELYGYGFMKTEKYPDNDAYYGCQRAKAFYLKAMQVATNEQTKALCLRMAGRCEKQQIMVKNYPKRYDIENWDDYIFNQNPYYQRVKQDYPQFSDELLFQCTSFDEFYQKLE
ncbi:MAG: hypothetical protein MUE81_06205 [Thermoflexibacter sp.]|nr:hypothetical protein [Thermoflexibacter sp.]